MLNNQIFFFSFSVVKKCNVEGLLGGGIQLLFPEINAEIMKSYMII